MKPFEGYDFGDFWSEDEYLNSQYNCGILNDDDIEKAQFYLNCLIPNSYQNVLRIKNGGIPNYNCYELEHGETKTIEITAILGIGEFVHSLSGMYGSRYAIEHLGYPDIGIYFAETNNEGLFVLPYIHDKNADPMVCYVDQQNDFAIYPLEHSLEAFFQQLLKIEPILDTFDDEPF